METYGLARIPEQFELQRALGRFPRNAKRRLIASVLSRLNIDLESALEGDAQTLTSKQRRIVAQTMQDFGAAFMVGAVSASA